MALLISHHCHQLARELVVQQKGKGVHHGLAHGSAAELFPAISLVPQTIVASKAVFTCRPWIQVAVLMQNVLVSNIYSQP